MSDTATFDGFPEAGLQFLRDIEANNNKEWFQANRDRYDADLMAPAQAFQDAILVTGFQPLKFLTGFGRAEIQVLQEFLHGCPVIQGLLNRLRGRPREHGFNAVTVRQRRHISHCLAEQFRILLFLV